MDFRIFSQIPEEDACYTSSREYALHCAHNPDPGSKFDERTKALRGLSDSELLAAMKADGYDMVLGYERDEICGHFAFQRQEDSLHVFSMMLRKGYGGGRNLWYLVNGFLEQIRTNEEKRRIRISEGGSEKIKSLLHILKIKEKKLRIKVDLENYWIEMVG